MSFGLSDEYLYSEYFLDSYDNSGQANVVFPATDWPRFELGGKMQLKNVVAIKFLNAEIPFSFYIFTTTNQNFTFQETGQILQTISIPIGNYSASQMTVLLSSLLTAATLVGATYTVTIDTYTSKLLVTSNNATVFTLTFGSVGGTGNNSPRLYLGFNGGPIVSSAQTIQAPNTVNLSGPNYIYLNSLAIGSLLDCNLTAGAVNLGGGNSSIQVAKIPVTAGPNSVIFYDDKIPEMWFDIGEIATLQALDLYLSLGNLGSTSTIKPISLNGLNFSVKMGVLRRKTTDDKIQGGGYDQGRVVKRSRPY